ncbi:MAG TPA: hypothetical protein VFF03_00925 [Rhodocyclaceae bacterium]|nr:hypothetical protein [Rhodocyclaceae bacterium]
MSETTVGGWSAFSFELTPEAKAAFAEATKSFVGASYTPFAFATQVVAGTNYCYLAQGKPATLNPTPFVAKVYVFQPLPGQGQAHITQVVHITP